MRIDGAKTGVVHEYTDHPEIARRIGKACGGKNGRMPYFFQFSLNGRKDSINNKVRRYCASNNSTMNRICAMFSDIRYVNMNYAKVDQFNYQMLLPGPCPDTKPEIPELFCVLDNAKLATVIRSQENAYSNEKQLINSCNVIAEDIIREMTEKYGSLENAYPYVVKFLFAGDGSP